MMLRLGRRVKLSIARQVNADIPVEDISDRVPVPETTLLRPVARESDRISRGVHYVTRREGIASRLQIERGKIPQQCG